MDMTPLRKALRIVGSSVGPSARRLGRPLAIPHSVVFVHQSRLPDRLPVFLSVCLSVRRPIS